MAELHPFLGEQLFGLGISGEVGKRVLQGWGRSVSGHRGTWAVSEKGLAGIMVGSEMPGREA